MGARALTAAGHEVCKVPMQGLESATDGMLLARCVSENRALVTFDLDFANPVVYSPAKHAGVAVLRLPGRATPADLDRAIATFIEALRRNSLVGQLWIVEMARARVYDPED